MSEVFAERPRFFEGQYLGAEDLEVLLGYLREQSERHLLGAHTWGIVSGVELLQKRSAIGGIQWLLTPGIVTDGYGRLIVVQTPLVLGEDLFAQQPSGRVDIWIRFDEAAFGGARRGLGSCGCSDEYERVSEAFVIEVGARRQLDLRSSGVVVGDDTFSDVREALGSYRDEQPIACDGSVPAQLFPTENEPSRWLVPVGRVPWKAGSPGEFVEPTDADRKSAKMFRRQAGIVAEQILAADGVLRLRNRFSRRAGTTDHTCALDEITERDVVRCGEQLEFRELIWMEGATRFAGDVRLRGTRLEFQEAEGTDYLDQGIPFLFRRRPTQNALGGSDLELLLGERQANTGPNRFTIGKAKVKAGTSPCSPAFDYDAGVFVQEDAKVGIGTGGTLLALPLTIRAIGATGDLIGFENAAKKLAWQFNFGANANGLNVAESDPKGSRLFIKTGGDVGIGTLTPGAKLDVTTVQAGPGQALGAGKWIQAGDGEAGGRFWVQYGMQLAPLMVLSGSEHPPRLQLQQVVNGDETMPDRQSWIGHARNRSSDLAMMGGNVGIGTLTPFRPLHVAGEVHSSGAGAGFSFGNRESGSVESPGNGERWVWYATTGTARLWSGGDKLGVTANGSLGVGTTTPVERLDVRGNVRLGANAEFFGVGGLENFRMLAGTVNDLASSTTGVGFSVAHFPGSGEYRITYAVPFSDVPVVVATLHDAMARDNFITVEASSAQGFTLVATSDNIGADADAQDTAFNFIVVGKR